MKFSVLTLFPEMIEQGLNTSILKRARENGLIEINPVNIRDYTTDKHGRVDDYTYGGGAGMLIQAQPVYGAWKAVTEGRKVRTVYVTPQGSVFTQEKARELAGEEELVFLCGHYEGIDERVLEEVVTDYLSIGDYILTGGELASMVMIDSISRLIPGVLHNEESAETESFYKDLLEYPQYSRPEIWHDKAVPAELLTGNHKIINAWRLEQSIARTGKYRPDLLAKYRERERVLELLYRRKKENAYLIDAMERGTADVLACEGENVVAIQRSCNQVMICAVDYDAAVKLLSAIPGEVRLVLHNMEALNPVLSDMLGLKVSEPYRQGVYTLKVSAPVPYKNIRQVTLQDDVEYITEHYDHGSGAYVRRQVEAGNVYAAFDGERMIAFAGMHADGSVGMLYVEEEYRRGNVGISLAAYVMNLALQRGGLPYAHTALDNEASLRLQEKLGMYFAKENVYWLYRGKED